MNLYPSAEVESGVAQEREHDRELLLGALQEQGLKPAQPETPFDAFTAELAHALHLYLARSAATLAALQIEDLLGETLPVNVPGTDKEYPNWQRKLSVDIEEMAVRADLAAQFGEIRLARA